MRGRPIKRTLRDLDMRSKVHPKYKTKYRVGHGSAYEQALVQRGDVTLGLSADATDAWRPSPSGRPGAPKTFSDCAIETALTRRLVFRVPVRQAEGFWRSVLSLMGVDRAAPDHTSLSRRSQSLAVACRRIPSSGPLHRIVDSTGLSMVGEGEWAAVHHGGRGHRGGKTRHLAVDRVGVIVAHALTEPTVDDATIGIDLIATGDDAIARVTADAAYETVAFYAAAEMRDATVVVPPSKTARVSRRRPRSRARDRTITDVRTLGRRRWKQEAGYQLQARVENAFFRYTSILGDRLRARSRGGRVAESVVACTVLNQLTELGRPESYRIGRCLASGLESLTVSFESCTSAAPPLEERRLADPMTTQQIGDRDARFGFFQNPNDLALAELRLPHNRSFESGAVYLRVSTEGGSLRAEFSSTYQYRDGSSRPIP